MPLDRRCQERRIRSPAPVARPPRFAGVPCLRDPHARTEIHRLHEHGKPQATDDPAEDRTWVTPPVALENHLVVDDRQPAGCENQLHGPLVHTDGRGQDPRTHIRHIGKLEQSLDGAVLAERSVQHGKDNVKRQTGHRGVSAVDRQERVATRVSDQMGLASQVCMT